MFLLFIPRHAKSNSFDQGPKPMLPALGAQILHWTTCPYSNKAILVTGL